MTVVGEVPAPSVRGRWLPDSVPLFISLKHSTHIYAYLLLQVRDVGSQARSVGKHLESYRKERRETFNEDILYPGNSQAFSDQIFFFF